MIKSVPGNAMIRSMPGNTMTKPRPGQCLATPRPGLCISWLSCTLMQQPTYKRLASQKYSRGDSRAPSTFHPSCSMRHVKNLMFFCQTCWEKLSAKFMVQEKP
eukprot:441869-Pelagomonas_calceolata.AAC.3